MHTFSLFCFGSILGGNRPYPTSLPGMPIWVQDLGSAVFAMPRCGLLSAPFFSLVSARLRWLPSLPTSEHSQNQYLCVAWVDLPIWQLRKPDIPPMDISHGIQILLLVDFTLLLLGAGLEAS
jgi:hypothetical protein